LVYTNTQLAVNFFMTKKEQILNLVGEYIEENKKSWSPGKDWVQYAGPYFDKDEYISSVDTLLNGWLVLGKHGISFETDFPKLLNKEHGILTNSGSSSNLIMMSALTSKRLYNFPKGTKVITPIAGFPTTVNPIFQLGFEPLFVDIDLDTLNLNLEQVEDQAKKGAKAITFAHVLGNPPNMDILMEIIQKYNLVLLEDCCDALGSTYDGKPLGSFGEFASCSFYPAHHITMGEGGFIGCNSHDQEVVIRSFREWGRGCYCVGLKANLLKNGSCGNRFSNWLPSLPDEIFDHKYVYDEIGYNLKPIEIQAAMGLEQIKKLPKITELRKANHSRLLKIFKPYEDYFILPSATPKSDPSWFAFAVTIKDNSKFNRFSFVNFLESHKIQTRPYFAGNIMLQPAYDGLMNPEDVISKFPVSRKVTTDTFFLGTSPVITSQHLDYVEEVVSSFFNSNKSY
jgi:CDP-4-dehydro-6-deoxyglucose reductase, E1